MSRRQLPNTTQVPNIYLDRLMYHLSGDEFKVLMYVNRRVLGFHLNHAPVSIRQIARGIGRFGRDGEALELGTGLSLEFIVKTVAFLVRAGVLIEVRPSFGGRAPHYDVAIDAGQIDWELIEQRSDERRQAGSRRVAKARESLGQGRADAAAPQGSLLPDDDAPSAEAADARSVAQNKTRSVIQNNERSVLQNTEVKASAKKARSVPQNTNRSVTQNSERSAPQNTPRSVAQDSGRSVIPNGEPGISFGATEQILETKKEKGRSRGETQVESGDPGLRNQWEKVLNLLEMQIPRATYASWVRPTRALRLHEGLLTVRVENAYARDWLDTRLYDMVTRASRDVMGEGVRVAFVVDGQEPDDKHAAASGAVVESDQSSVD